MRPEHMDAKARRVISGVNEENKSYIVRDEFTECRTALPAFTVNDVWRFESVPTRFNDDDTLTGEAEFAPPPGGIVVRLVTFAPDSAVDAETYGQTIETFLGPGSDAGDDLALGMHTMDTVDVDTVVSGEIYCIFENGEETLLRAGDTIVNRGTTHAWSNRTNKPATVVATVVPARH